MVALEDDHRLGVGSDEFFDHRLEQLVQSGNSSYVVLVWLPWGADIEGDIPHLTVTTSPVERRVRIKQVC